MRPWELEVAAVPGACGWVLGDDGDGLYRGDESQALIEGLRQALDRGVRRIVVKTTSDILREPRRLAKRFESFRIQCVRETPRARMEAERALRRDLRPLKIVVAFGSYDELPFISHREPRWLSKSVDLVDPYTNQRRRLPEMPEFDVGPFAETFSHVGVKAVTVGSRIYFLGGTDHPGGVRSLDPTRKRPWARHAVVSDAVSGAAVVTSGGLIFHIGGKLKDDLDFLASRRVDVFDPKAETWIVGPETAAPRADTAAAATDGYVIVVGGTTSFISEFDDLPKQEWTAITAVEALDVHKWTRDHEERWTKLPSLPEALFGVGLVAFDSIVYSLGGHAIAYTQRTRLVKSVYALDLTKEPGSWEVLGSLPVATANARFFDLGHGYFVVASSRHGDFVVDLRREQGEPRCRVVRDGWPRRPTHAALLDPYPTSTCLGAERNATAALGVVLNKRRPPTSPDDTSDDDLLRRDPSPSSVINL